MAWLAKSGWGRWGEPTRAVAARSGDEVFDGGRLPRRFAPRNDGSLGAPRNDSSLNDGAGLLLMSGKNGLLLNGVLRAWPCATPQHRGWFSPPRNAKGPECPYWPVPARRSLHCPHIPGGPVPYALFDVVPRGSCGTLLAFFVSKINLL